MMKLIQAKLSVVVSAAILLSACTSTTSQDITKPYVFHGPAGNFCQMGTETNLGGLATTPNVLQYSIGKCKQKDWNKEDFIVLFFGDAGEQESRAYLAEELDAYLHPDNYFTSDEIAELDCTADSQCKKNAEFLQRGVVVHFKSDSSTLSNKDEIELVRRIAIIAKDKRVVLAVTGYTDITATDQHNVALSQKRADAIQQLLSADGLNKQMIVTNGRGSASPIDTNETSSGRENNRRAEIKQHAATGEANVAN